MTRHPAVSIRTTGALYFAVSTPCGESWAGMTNSDDLAIQVRKALAHAGSCKDCKRAERDTETAPAPCTAETWSWDHFNTEQVDGYWIRCSLLGQHDDHQDEHTGLSWTGTSPSPSGGDPVA